MHELDVLIEVSSGHHYETGPLAGHRRRHDRYPIDATQALQQVVYQLMYTGLDGPGIFRLGFWIIFTEFGYV